MLFCIDTLSNGGAEKLLIDLLRRLDYTRYEVTLLVLQNWGLYLDRVPPQVIRQTQQECSTAEFDVEIAFGEGMAVEYIANHPSRARKIAWIHCDLFELHWTSVFFEDDFHEQLCFAQMNRIVFVSELTKRQFAK